MPWGLLGGIGNLAGLIRRGGTLGSLAGQGAGGYNWQGPNDPSTMMSRMPGGIGQTSVSDAIQQWRGGGSMRTNPPETPTMPQGNYTTPGMAGPQQPDLPPMSVPLGWQAPEMMRTLPDPAFEAFYADQKAQGKSFTEAMDAWGAQQPQAPNLAQHTSGPMMAPGQMGPFAGQGPWAGFYGGTGSYRPRQSGTLAELGSSYGPTQVR